MAKVLGHNPLLKAVERCTDLEEAIAKLSALRPDIILVHHRHAAVDSGRMAGYLSLKKS